MSEVVDCIEEVEPRSQHQVHYRYALVVKSIRLSTRREFKRNSHIDVYCSHSADAATVDGLQLLCSRHEILEYVGLDTDLDERRSLVGEHDVDDRKCLLRRTVLRTLFFYAIGFALGVFSGRTSIRKVGDALGSIKKHHKTH